MDFGIVLIIASETERDHDQRSAITASLMDSINRLAHRFRHHDGGTGSAGRSALIGPDGLRAGRADASVVVGCSA
jgi:hypothetical protein